MNSLTDAPHGGRHIGSQQCLRLVLVNAQTTVHIGSCMAETDRPDARTIRIGREPQPLEAARQCKPHAAVLIIIHPFARLLHTQNQWLESNPAVCASNTVWAPNPSAGVNLSTIPAPVRAKAPHEWSALPWQQRQPMTSRSSAADLPATPARSAPHSSA